jgi:putative spermidine/putrescine transport system substrate-binding protein
MSKKILLFISILLIAGLVMAACQPAAPPAEEPAAEEPAAEEPAAEEPAAEEPAAEEPAAEEPAEEPAAEEPAEEPAEDPMADEGDEFVISFWGYNMESLEEIYLNTFSEMYDIEVVVETGNNSERLAKVESRKGNPTVDVIHMSSNFPFRAAELGLVETIDVSKLENYDELYEWAQDPQGGNVCIGYAVSSGPIIYRTDLVDPPPTSWNDLLRDDLAGNVAFPDLPTTFGPSTIIMLALANGGSIDDLEPGWAALPQLAENAVTTFKRNSELVTLVQEEEVYLSPYGSFAIGNLMDTGHPLEIAIPEEGVPASLSQLCIVAGTDNPELAHKYINLLTSHDVQKAIAEAFIDSPTNTSVELSDEVGSKSTYGDLIDVLVFPDYAYLETVMEEWQERWNEIMLK